MNTIKYTDLTTIEKFSLLKQLYENCNSDYGYTAKIESVPGTGGFIEPSKFEKVVSFLTFFYKENYTVLKYYNHNIQVDLDDSKFIKDLWQYHLNEIRIKVKEEEAEKRAEEARKALNKKRRGRPKKIKQSDIDNMFETLSKCGCEQHINSPAADGHK